MQSVGRQAVQHAQRPRLQISAEGRIAEFEWNNCAALVSLALQSYLGAEAGFATAACEVWVVQLKEADGVSSGKTASSGKVEVMRKRIALSEVPLAWEEDCATVLGCGSVDFRVRSHHFGGPSAPTPQLCPQRSVHSGSESVGGHVQRGW